MEFWYSVQKYMKKTATTNSIWVEKNILYLELIFAPLGAFPKSLGFCSGDPESSLAEIFDFCPKNIFLESR